MEKEQKVALGAAIFAIILGIAMMFLGTKPGGHATDGQKNKHIVYKNAGATTAANEQTLSLGDITLGYTGGKITLSGKVPDEKAKNRLLKAARAHFGADNVVDNITIDSSASPFWWKTRPFEVFAGLKKLSEFDLNLSGGNQIGLKGKAANDAIKSFVLGGLEKWFIDDPKVDADITVDAGIVADKTDDNALLTYPIEFSTGSSAIPEKYQAQLVDIAEVLADEERKIKITGYTDNVGDAVDNQKLSQERADSVKTFLVSNGAIADNIVTEGLGQENPIGDNATAEGRQKNRRIVFSNQ